MAVDGRDVIQTPISPDREYILRGDQTWPNNTLKAEAGALSAGRLSFPSPPSSWLCACGLHVYSLEFPLSCSTDLSPHRRLLIETRLERFDTSLCTAINPR